MENVEEGNLKGLGVGQKSLFDFAECRVPRKEESRDGMPSWFWKLAQECRAEILG